MRQKEERMKLVDPEAKVSPPKRCRVCRMRRWKENQDRGRFMEVKKVDDARIKGELDRERVCRLNQSGSLTKVLGVHMVLVQEFAKMGVCHG